MNSLTNNSTINNAKNWWHKLSQRERLLMLAFSAMIALAIFYWGLYKPLNDRAQQARNNLIAEKETHAFVVSTANKISSYRASGPKTRNNQTLSQIVSNSAATYKVSMVRTQPKSKELQVWIQPVPFQTLVRWFASLKEQGVYVQLLDIERAGVSGVVEVKRLQFTKPD